ncbi:unnamed protein product [Parnassius mnemosyne]|uniref:Peptidase A2 domain-containing protein n=1 Tax=Parnassius mnemosyne TaxID=213953 RepID=A0AAV1L1L6_9NEOP
MENFIKIQIDILSRIKKTLINYNKSPKERINATYIEIRIQNLDAQWTQFLETHARLIDKCGEKELFDSNYFKNNIYDETENAYIETKTVLRDELAKLQSVHITEKPNFEKGVECTNVKLPKISIPTFSGKYAEWTTFRDLFITLIHKNASIENIQKMHYLKAHLIGEVEQLLRHIPVTAANYLESWNLLNKLYDNKKYLTNCLLKRFMSQPNVSVSSRSIKELLDTTVECLNGLKNIGVVVESWDVIVIYIVSAKLDNETRKLWESTISASDDLPKFDEFSKFLENRFRSLEFLDTKVRTKPVSKQSVLHALKTNTSSISLNNCQYCQGSHKIAHCKQFARQDYDSRQSFVQNNNLCFNCLGNNHSVYFCRQNSKCHVCKRKHHSLLHPNRKPSKVTIGNAESGVVNTVTETVQPNESTSITSCFSNIQSHVLLATAFVKVLSKIEVGITFRYLLDQGSQASFITENAVQTLGLKKIPTKVVISGVGGQEGLVSKHIVVANLQSIHDPHFLIKVKLHVLDKLTAFMPSKKFAVQLWSKLSELRLADPKFYIPNKVDLLLGAEVYGQILEDGLIKGPPGSPVAQNTKFGWILSGQIHSSSHTGLECNSNNRIVSMHSYVDENEVLRRFWEIESDDFSYKKSKILTPEQQKCEEIFSHTTSRDDSGRYVVNLPFRDEDPRCKYGNSRKIATRRLQLLEKRLEKNTELKIQYSAVLQEYLDLGHMELVPEKEKEDVHVVYLPHHAVVKEDRTTSKIRIVFDASCKGSNGVSLNNDLLVGPVLQPDLRHIVLRWRQHPIILVADLVKMYRQIKVTKEHCNFQRIV